MKHLHTIRLRLTRFPWNDETWCMGRFPWYEFHIHAEARKKYQFEEKLYTSTGNVIFPNFHAVRIFAKKLNDHRNLEKHPENAVKAGHLNAMGLIDEINHYMMRRYEEVENPGVFARAMHYLNERVGREKCMSLLLAFGNQFPAIEVYRGALSVEEYLSRSADNKSHSEVMLEEMILLWFANINPAFAPFKELFNDHGLREQTAYQAVVDTLQIFFSSEKAASTEGLSILDLLRAPILASPHSLEGQLAYIRRNWGMMLSKHFIDKMAGAGDLIKEESKVIIPASQHETVVPRYAGSSVFGELDSERFTTDLEWMPNVVLIAKNTYVWLDQLSRKYSRAITTLDRIPDEELDQLAGWNINALWLIGIWERSRASQRIKQMMGNPEAVASAYSLYDYEIAGDLGGEGAFQNLRARAWHRGIRLAGDMVPNHVGLYAKWIIERPEYFMQSEYSPFPNYTFTGPNLSDHHSIEIRIEDGYWTKRDAAVVFQRFDRSTMQTTYIYHGNDGTHMPWNDTAQLDFLRSEVREAVLQAILHVAQKFPIIRFDAAMVLAKQHFQRLWYPQPGSGGDIPSRVDHAMSKEEFDRFFPDEFWREVVDCINAEMPNTLLLAEAFWLLEGYFVRTLGMHRVYNSAFMHMMMKEENVKYRELIANTLAFNPEILKRYVNFMSNPDERTTVDQFGKGDKYFGVAMMMATIPGLPMLAHGQVEGFTEKYGMEYKRAYYEEQPDRSFVERHEREIFPILRKRYLFGSVTNFELYHILGPDGVNLEHVFCYSNRSGDERMLFLYNNRYEETAGRTGTSVPKVRQDGAVVSIMSVGEGLGVRAQEMYFYVLKEHRSQLEYLHSGRELWREGMFVSLQGYQYQLFLGIEERHDSKGEYDRLSSRLHGRGVRSIDRALEEMRLEPVHMAFRSLIDREALNEIEEFWLGGGKNRHKAERVPADMINRYRKFIAEVMLIIGKADSTNLPLEQFENDIAAVKRSIEGLRNDEELRVFQHHMSGTLKHHAVFILFTWMIFRRLDEIYGQSHIVDRLLLWDAVEQRETQHEDPRQHTNPVLLLRALASYRHIFSEMIVQSTLEPFITVCMDSHIQSLLQVNTYDGVTYYGKEQFDELVDWLLIAAIVTFVASGRSSETERSTTIKQLCDVSRQLKEISDRSSYRFLELQKYLLVGRTELRHEAPARSPSVTGNES